MNSLTPYLIHPYAPYVFPFALFAICTYVAALFGISQVLLYPIKMFVVAASLSCYWNAYKQEIKFSLSWVGVIAGVLVFLIWVLPEGLYPQIGQSSFNPYAYAKRPVAYSLIVCRLGGATLIVPLMEELFWRSFALRLSINPDFKSVPLGEFSWFSFIFVSVVFGFEHHRWLVGIVAGMIYTALLYRSKNLFVPILSHGVTNLLLGLYVVSTYQWSFW